jgi:hypothetical protein
VRSAPRQARHPTHGFACSGQATTSPYEWAGGFVARWVAPLVRSRPGRCGCHRMKVGRQVWPRLVWPRFAPRPNQARCAAAPTRGARFPCGSVHARGPGNAWDVRLGRDGWYRFARHPARERMELGSGLGRIAGGGDTGAVEEGLHRLSTAGSAASVILVGRTWGGWRRRGGRIRACGRRRSGLRLAGRWSPSSCPSACGACSGWHSRRRRRRA